MSVLIFIIVLVLLIVGHELGHFLVAKKTGMRVDEFGVGFPPKIVGKKVGETEYTLNWLPFGGFVRIHGENETESEDPRAFSSRSAAAQAATLAAGPFANIVIAFVLSSVAFMAGAPAVVDGNAAVENAQNVSVIIADVLPDSPADVAGLEVGDYLLSIKAGDIVTNTMRSEDVAQAISSSDTVVSVTISRRGEEHVLVVEPTTGLVEESPEVRAIGIAPVAIGVVSYPVHIAVWKGLVDTVQDFVFVLVSLATLIGSAFTLSADVSQLAGPVGIASLTGEAAAFGFGSLLSFAALLSVNLAIINLLPFPALDGGRLVMVGIERVFRRPIPTAVTQAVNTAGFIVLILLMVAVTVGDISRLLG